MSLGPGRWLLVGALGVETLPLILRMHRRSVLTPRVVTGQLGGREVAVATVGVGPRQALSRGREAVQRFQPDAVLSLGTCGALVDALDVGAVVAASSVRLEGGPARGVTRLQGLPAVGVVTVSRAVHEPTHRSRLQGVGDSVCEMEAVSVLQAADGRPFAALKVVSDMAGASVSDLIGPPDPLRQARFARLAQRLVRDRLLPELLRLLRE